ncbi:MAG: DMT family transporter [Candidatus Krumholzibacteriota bacterium]|nr:DMT family transporter [Candidatus Krumholzibacteriota bacterium]
MSVPYLGEALSFIAAVFWAFALVLFRRSGEKVHPIALNLFKDVLALVLYVPTIYIAGETLFHPAPTSHYVLLLASGAIGIAIGDSLLFWSLNLLGAGGYALVSSLYSPFVILLSYLFLSEQLSLLQTGGVLLIVVSVFEATRKGGHEATSRKRQLIGALLGVSGVLSMAVGIVMIKPVLDTAPLFWAVEIRLVGGVAALLIILALHPARRRIVSSLFVRSHRGVTVGSSLLGGYIAMACWMGGMKLTQASIASALNQTYIVFTLIFAAVILGERITKLRVLAILTALAGATMVTFG